MNIYAVIILITMLAGYATELIADILNLNNLKPELPEEFKDTHDEEKYRKSQEYTRVNTRFGFITSTLSLAGMLIFWFAGGFPFVESIVQSISGNIIWRGLLFVGILMLLSGILSLPFTIYSTFVIEEKFGFNKTTPKTFVLDMLKGIGLSVVLGAPLLALVIWILQSLGSAAWLVGWGAVTVIGLFIQFIAPRYIMPIFNKFTPLEDGKLREMLMNYAAKVKFPLQNVYVIDGSKRSSKSNAFFTGFGKYKRIALFDTLIKNQSEEEIVAVLAHEIGHYKKKHIQTGMLISFLHTGLLFYLLTLFLNSRGLYEAFYMQNMPIYAGMLFFGMLYSPVETILGIVMNIISRKNEYEADEFSATTIDNPGVMITALKKLSGDNLSNLTPHPFHVFLNYSHPPMLERIKAIRSL